MTPLLALITTPEGLVADVNDDIAWEDYCEWAISLSATHGGKYARDVLSHMVRNVERLQRGKPFIDTT